MAYGPYLSANTFSLPYDGSASSHQLLRDNQGILCWDIEQSESRGIKPLHQGIKILSQEVRNGAQVKSLSAASLGEDLKGISQQTNAKHTTETILEETDEPQQMLPTEHLYHVGKKGVQTLSHSGQAPSLRATQGSCTLSTRVWKSCGVTLNIQYSNQIFSDGTKMVSPDDISLSST